MVKLNLMAALSGEYWWEVKEIAGERENLFIVSQKFYHENANGEKIEKSSK